MQPIGRSESVDIRDRDQQGASLSPISREMGHARATIPGIVRAVSPRPLEHPARRHQPRLLSPYKEDYPSANPGGLLECGGVVR
jgi:transposase